MIYASPTFYRSRFHSLLLPSFRCCYITAVNCAWIKSRQQRMVIFLYAEVPNQGPEGAKEDTGRRSGTRFAMGSSAPPGLRFGAIPREKYYRAFASEVFDS
jgi:hypothetical protein